MKVLVTGGCGFIGSHIVENLSSANEVSVVDDFFSGLPKNKFIGIDYYDFSITNIKKLNDMMSKNKFDTIYHQAAIPSVPRSVKDPIRSSQVNIIGTLNVLECAKKHNINRFIFASSSSIYGNLNENPKNEKMQMKPISPYALTKSVGEDYLKLYHKIWGMQTYSLRYFNVYGPRQNPNSEYAAVIPKFISQAMKNMNLTIFGDGEQTRDFTFVKDIAHANQLLLNSQSGYGESYNVAQGKATSVNKLADLIITLTDSNSDIVHFEERLGDVKNSLADSDKFEKLTGYKPKTSLKDGLEQTIRHIEMSNNIK